MKSLARIAFFALAMNCQSQIEQAEYYYDDSALESGDQVTPEERQVLAEVSAIYDELGEIRRRGNSKEEVAQHRAYRLVPTLRQVARKAGDLSSTILFGKAIELASCESVPERSYEWTDVFSKAANKFKESDFRMLAESLPDANRRSFKEAMAANLPGSFKWREALANLPVEATEDMVLDQEPQP